MSGIKKLLETIQNRIIVIDKNITIAENNICKMLSNISVLGIMQE